MEYLQCGAKNQENILHTALNGKVCAFVCKCVYAFVQARVCALACVHCLCPCLVCIEKLEHMFHGTVCN